jgi:hypothetical protein
VTPSVHDWDDADGNGIRSVQLVQLPAYESAFAYWGDACMLDQLLHHYFEAAGRAMAGLVRVRWERGGPVVRLRWPGLPLIVMGRPTLDVTADRRAIGVPILGGLLSTPTQRSRLSIVLTHCSPEIRALVVLERYRPRGHRLPIVRLVSRHVQGRLHVRVGHQFLRDLAARWESAGSSLSPPG